MSSGGEMFGVVCVGFFEDGGHAELEGGADIGPDFVADVHNVLWR